MDVMDVMVVMDLPVLLDRQVILVSRVLLVVMVFQAVMDILDLLDLLDQLGRKVNPVLLLLLNLLRPTGISNQHSKQGMMGKHHTEDYKLSAVKYALRTDNQVEICKVFDCKRSSLA
jgi:hypothetical protein